MQVDNSEIQFEDEYGESGFHIRSRKILGEPTTPTMVNFLLNKGIVKNEKQATIILLICIFVFLGLSIFILRNSLVNDEQLIYVDKYGREIPFEDYIELINKGQKP